MLLFSLLEGENNQLRIISNIHPTRNCVQRFTLYDMCQCENCKFNGTKAIYTLKIMMNIEVTLFLLFRQFTESANSEPDSNQNQKGICNINSCKTLKKQILLNKDS